MIYSLLHVNMSLSLICDNMPIGLRVTRNMLRAMLYFWLKGMLLRIHT
jgi:hypothetical protein